MDIRVFPEDESEDSPLFLRLINNSCGGVVLVACDSDGVRLHRASLATIDEHGIHRSVGVAHLGITLHNGRVATD